MSSQPRDLSSIQHMATTSIMDRWLAARMQRRLDPAAIRLELWDGESTYSGSHPALGSLIVGDRRTLLALAIDPDSRLGEAYTSGRLKIRGRLEPVIRVLMGLSSGRAWRARVSSVLAAGNSLIRSRRNAQHHYDIGNAFYERWLDRGLVYTCAYYEDEKMTLAQAQCAKLDLICRKLRLRPGETVVEAGCGWGALALHMAKHYGVRVKAFNVSRQQLEYAREQAMQEGLSDSVEFIDDDYRNVTGDFDVFVSVGMLEHVGRRHFRSLAEVIQRSVRRDKGRGLLHFIGRDVPRPLNAWIARRLFPGAYPPTLDEVAAGIIAPAGMSVLDVENLRWHYARTLEDWAGRFAAVKEEVCRRYGQEFQRTWELYLAGAAAAFAVGNMQLFQVVFSPRHSAPLSWTRSDAYEPPSLRG